jgi:hypothetical protein
MEVRSTRDIRVDHDILDEFESWIVCEFRANGGRLEAPFSSDNLILLNTRAADSGRMRPVPVTAYPDPTGLVVAAVDRPGQGYPIWYLNLVADPWALVETGAASFQAWAQFVTEPARTTLRDRLMRIDPELAGAGAALLALVRLVRGAPS